MAWTVRTCFLILMAAACVALVLQGHWCLTSLIANSRKLTKLQSGNWSESGENTTIQKKETLLDNTQGTETAHYKIVKAREAKNLHYVDEIHRFFAGLPKNKSVNGSDYFPTHAQDKTTLKPEVTNVNDPNERIERLRQKCWDRNLFKRERKKASMSEMYYSAEHDFAYCKVPKSGSTFWMELFLVLKLGKNYSSYLYNHSRMEIHERTRKFVSEPLKIAHGKSRTVIVSRNPFSRLHSAYIDKVYLPMFWHQFDRMEGSTLRPSYHENFTQIILKKTKKVLSAGLLKYKDLWLKRGFIEVVNVSKEITPVCSNNSTFEQFLKLIISEVEAGRILEAHWAPISHLCRPCLFNTYKIVKQESFEEDVLNVLETFGIDINAYPTLKDSLSDDSRAQLSAPGIISVVDSKAYSKTVSMCISHQEITRRLWKSFQIQGFLNDKSQLPPKLLKGNFSRFEVTDEVLKAIAAKPLTSKERAQQRWRYLAEAYEDVSVETINKIKDIYKLDFLLFDYPLTHPALNVSVSLVSYRLAP